MHDRPPDPEEQRTRAWQEMQRDGKWRGVFDSCASSCGSVLVGLAAVASLAVALVSFAADR